MSAKGTIPFIGIYSGDMANRPTIAWGATGGLSTPPVVQNYQFMKLELKREAQITRLGDSNQQPTGYKKRQPVRTLSVTLVTRVTAGSGAVAAAALAATAAPPDLTKVTITKVVAAADTVINGDWVYESGAQTSFSPDGEAETTFDLVQQFTDAGVLVTADTLLAEPS